MTRGRVGAYLVTLGLLALTVTAGARLEREPDRRTIEQDLLYLPNGKYLRVASLGHAGLVADLIYLWAIQYYANYERQDRYRYVEHVFGNVITELDPHYVDPYWLGALVLTVEAHDLEAGLRLLDRGFALNPHQWVFPYLAGWECSHAGQAERAAVYFRQAAAVPGAPPRVLRLAAGMRTRAGDLLAALEEWRQVRDDPRSDAATIAIAERQVRELTVKVDLAELERAIGRFRERNGHLPRSLEELRRAAYIDRRPLDPRGREYAYDPRTGRVSSPAGRLLGTHRAS